LKKKYRKKERGEKPGIKAGKIKGKKKGSRWIIIKKRLFPTEQKKGLDKKTKDRIKETKETTLIS
jgi:hypothetical protein